MLPIQVANVLRRFDGTSNQMRRWIKRLDAELYDK